MFSALLVGLLLSADADAGEIFVNGLAPSITVDGVPVELSSTSVGYLARDLSAGRHVLEARALTGGTIAISYIDVPVDTRVLVSYRKKMFTVTGQTKITAAAPPAAKPTSNLGSVAFRGLDPSTYRVDLAGRGVAFQPEWGAFIATDLRPGAYPVSLYRMGALVMAGEVTVAASGHAICTLQAYDLGVAGSCAAAGPALPSSELAVGASVTGGAASSTTTASAGGVSVQVVLSGAPAAIPAEGAPPPPPAAPPPVQPMSESAVTSLANAVQKATFGDDQVDVLRTAAAHNAFTCAQVVRLVAPIAHSSDKVDGIKALAPKVLDPENAHLIEDALTFSSDKEEVRKLFR